jgi:DNA-binding MarR family transcriptional regulator
VLRVHLTADDLLRTRFASQPAPLIETGHAIAVLGLAVTQRTTTELARDLGVSAATVSGHTKALRAAGLIVTVRAGKAVLHSVTPLGARLLEAVSRPPDPVR